MHISKINADATRIEAMQRAQQNATGQASTSTPDAPTDVRRADAVQISDAGRALAGAGSAPQDSKVSELDPHRAAVIRARVLTGAYNSIEMADQVARSIVRSGDL